MKKKIIILISVQAVLFIGICAFMLLTRQEQPRTAYVEIATVYDAFKMKKELEGRFSNVEMFRKAMLDSMELNLQMLGSEFQKTQADEDKSAYLEKRQEYLTTKKQFEEDNAAVSQQYTEQIFTQLNQYITDYGKEHGYQYIFGAEGNGSLMYANDSENITEEITAYVNEQYKGLN